MSDERRNVLLVGVGPDVFQQVAPFLGRDAFELDRFPSAEGALELTSHVAFEVLIVRFPLPGMELLEFLGRVRSEDNRCVHSSLLLLVDPEDAEEARKFIGRGANRVVVLGESEEQIQHVVSGLLNVAPRKAARFLARLEVKLDDTRDMILCQTENVSATGMLIKTDRRYEKGTKITFEFTLPGDPRPIRGVAEMIRHTLLGRDPVGGIGLRFLSFAGDSKRRFDAYRTRQE